MGALAVMLKSLGHRVTGSDRDVYPPISTMLAMQQIPVYQGFDAAHLDPAPDLVVIGNAVSRGNPEAETVLERRMRYLSMPEALKDFFLWDRHPIVVTGTHGKTTTTSLIAHVLREAGFDPSYIIGGIPVGWETGARLGAGKYFLLEGDEYDSAFFDKRAKFLHYLPHIAVINNIEYDHADIYDDVDQIVLAFRRFINLVPRNGLIAGSADDARVRALLGHAHTPVQTFGNAPDARWSARKVTVSPTGTSFTLCENDNEIDEMRVPLYGIHNIQNVLAAIVATRQAGVDLKTVGEALQTFPGVKRRLEVKGEAGGVTVYDDFAHHPTAVSVTLKGLRAAFPKDRLWAVYEPRSATSIRRVFQDAFVAAFDDADRVVIAPVFNAYKAPEENRFSVEDLVTRLAGRGKLVDAPPDIDAIVALLAKQSRPGDRIVFMSNGGFGGIHDRCLQALSARQ
ncbi:MAG: UDP-N-acetylmuramate:L-alanyl-gamma-D-glutamyl-meso-diaminopimelate ligase [candidate division Zixibacteria bacterium]|nr:UDP-N-acetylmuramate:L-alanyl-gamma-D-glutamyl-meso-diaminopimelate ligase [candidate division Zixibacteria bacterium]